MPGEVPYLARPALAGGDSDRDVYDDGRLRVEHDNYYVSCDGRPLALRRAEFLLLSRLARSASRVVKAEELWHYVWGDGKPYNSESLHVHIYRLRAKLAPFRLRIETMVHVGYRLMLDAEASADFTRQSA
ncbi:MAG TPA: helix-turn-helix domain-containing protein [Pyrinomonadaceae bacterium]|jgi:DNA-binding response OmpR family regulator